MVGEAELGGDTGERALALGQPLERMTDTEPVAVAGERLPRMGAEDAAPPLKESSERMSRRTVSCVRSSISFGSPTIRQAHARILSS